MPPLPRVLGLVRPLAKLSQVSSCCVLAAPLHACTPPLPVARQHGPYFPQACPWLHELPLQLKWPRSLCPGCLLQEGSDAPRQLARPVRQRALRRGADVGKVVLWCAGGCLAP